MDARAIRVLPADRRARTCDDIDFASLRGRNVAVLGAGSSAMDNAATALEAGADVDLFCRRAEPSAVQQYRWLTFAGFLRHIGEMPDIWRWRIMGQHRALARRLSHRHPRAAVGLPRLPHDLGRMDGRAHGNGRIRIETSRGPFHADFAICGLGTRQNIRARTRAFKKIADQIAPGRRFAPPPGEEDPLAALPYLGQDYAFQERVPVQPCGSPTSTSSASESTPASWPVGQQHQRHDDPHPETRFGIDYGPFEGDLQKHWESLLAYDV